jgi:hypothetical protein
MELAQDRVQWWALVLAVLNLRDLLSFTSLPLHVYTEWSLGIGTSGTDNTVVILLLLLSSSSSLVTGFLSSLVLLPLSQW